MVSRATIEVAATWRTCQTYGMWAGGMLSRGVSMGSIASANMLTPRESMPPGHALERKSRKRKWYTWTGDRR